MAPTHRKPDAAALTLEVEQMIADLLMRVFGGFFRPILVAIGGPGGTGKSTLAAQLARMLPDAAVLSLDAYKTPRAARQTAGIYGAHPDANKMQLIAEHLRLLRERQPFAHPVYCSVAGDALETRPFRAGRFNLIEGEVATYWDFRDLIDFSIYIDAHWRTQLNTRLTRDIEQRGYTPEKAIATFLHSNLREFGSHGAPSKQWSDMHLFCNHDYTLRVEAVMHMMIDHAG